MCPVRLQSHYLFRDRFGRPGKGNDKGKVEALVKTARRTFMVPIPKVPDLEALNAQLLAHCLERLDALAGPVLGHFATRDNWINQAMVDGFEAELAAAGKSAENHWYEADHGFANPTSARYDEEDAALAWQRTLDFFAAHLT